MQANIDMIKSIVAIVVVGGACIAFIVWTIRRAEDPARRLFKWCLTLPLLGYMIFRVAPMVGRGGLEAAGSGIPLAAICSLALAIIWRHDIAALIARPFGDLYTGGSVPPEPRPMYSIAQSHQKKGHYLEAIGEIRQQLERFPTDLEGHLLLAQIQAENLQDLPGAELTIHRFCAQPGHAPRNIVFALYSLADWHLRYGRDRDAAQRALEKVIELLPDTEFSLGAAQRIAHLGNTEMLLSPLERKKFAVPEAVAHLGLLRGTDQPKPPEPEPGKIAAEYVRHLEQHPFDTEVREKLALIYAEHYGRIDLAVDQLEQMIGQANQPARLVAHWLNVLADVQIRAGADYETVKATLERIIEFGPALASADTARRRIDLLKLEMKSKAQTAAVKLGTYEQNIGLKSARRPGQK